jgi:N-acetylglucosaminyldiphosphoundecaprenol N-acetyl-beta-D-mannosaminyltransferase
MTSASDASDSVTILGLPVSACTWNDILSVIDSAIESQEVGKYIAVTNTESMYHALRVPAHRNFIKNSDLSLCDGVGVCAVGWAHGFNIPRRNGPILQLECAHYGQQRGWRHFFYGGKDGVVEQLVENLAARYPEMICAGTYTPPFRELRPEEDDLVVELINEARPDIVWVGLGLLKQERWIAAHLDRVQVPWMIGVGAAFDYHAGVVAWAPRWIRSIGMEWLFRLIVQPRLRARRYWWSFVFVLEGVVAGFRTRIRRRA